MGGTTALAVAPLVYLVCQPYKYAVTVAYKLFHPSFKLVERVHHGFLVGGSMHGKLALLHMEKSVQRLVPAAKDIQGRLDTRIQHLGFGGVEMLELELCYRH